MKRLRLSKTAGLILGIGIFVIAFASLYMVYSGQGDEQERLDDSLSVTQAILPKLVSEKEDWESQLTTLESELTQWESALTRATSLLNRTAASFPESVESIEYDEELFRIADGWKLEIINLTASEPADQEAEDITYSVTSFTVKVSGEVADILGFINTIVTHEDFLDATVEQVNISIPVPLTEAEKEQIKEGFTGEIMEELTEEELTEEEREELLAALAAALAAAEEAIEKLEKPSATISLVMYSYRGE
jgi:hypothetical protein